MNLSSLRGLFSSKLKSHFLEVALKKIGLKNLSAQEAVKIFNDAESVTKDTLPELTLDEVAALTMYVVSKKTMKQKIIAAIGVLVTIVMGYIGGGLAPATQPYTTALQSTPPAMVLSDARRDSATAWVQANACSDPNGCPVRSVVISPSGVVTVNITDGDLQVGVEVPE